MVAPGIAEALLATAIGLVAAIPAVVIYNVFAALITGYRQALADAAAGVERLVSRDLDYRFVQPGEFDDRAPVQTRAARVPRLIRRGGVGLPWPAAYANSLDGDDLEENHEINVTPFIDVILVLLIIFMVAAPLATVDVNVDLPASTATAAPRPDKPMFVTVKADLSVSVGEDRFSRPAARRRARSRREATSSSACFCAPTARSTMAN